ncbi:hypothetical protein AB1L30_04800 [Bremerella sp. JC817]|uniref:hypothetical protein n=1 Tax=Bremerella sp. JC817 TaxID=3231756 RepID=UPI00345AB5B3
MPDYFLNTYSPLVVSPIGRKASEDFQLPPFVDGSIRREPDLEHKFPGISCLCRAGKFAPRLKMGDTIAYLTCKRRFGESFSHRRLTAVLRVKKIFENHELASEWYVRKNKHLPNNCIVPGNPPKPLEHSHQRHVDRKKLSDAKLSRRWDGQYRIRASRYGSYAICRKLFCDVSWEAPIVQDDDLIKAFGRVPGTQNPGAVPERQFLKFLKRLRVGIPPLGS